MKFLNCLVLLGLISCGSSQVKKRYDSDFSYQTSGVEQFFLPELPRWANFSSSAECFKNFSFHYMDFKKLQEVYQLSYPQMIELQALYNQQLEERFSSTAVHLLRPIEEASLFSNTLEKIRGGVRDFKIPAVAEVQVLWLESFTPDEIRKIINDSNFNEQIPILFSSCHSKKSLSQWLIQENLDDVGFYLLTAEWLSPFSFNNEVLPSLKLDLPKFLGAHLNITFRAKDDKKTKELVLP